jgi:hypothetical protein
VNFFENSEDETKLHKIDNSKHIVNNIYKPDPKDRIPREVSAKNINFMNSLYDKYASIKGNIANNNDDNSFDNEDDMSDNKYNNLKYEKSVMVNHVNELNDNDEYNPNLTQFNDEETSYNNFNNNQYNNKNKNNYQYNNKIKYTESHDKSEIRKNNPLDDLNNEDSLIKDHTKFRQFALNEINQSE